MTTHQELLAENALLRQIIGVLVDDYCGGEVIMTIGQLHTASPIDIKSDGEGRDDELTVYSLYPQ